MKRLPKPNCTYKGIKIYASRETNLSPMYTFEGSPIWADLVELCRIIDYIEQKEPMSYANILVSQNKTISVDKVISVLKDLRQSAIEECDWTLTIEMIDLFIKELNSL